MMLPYISGAMMPPMLKPVETMPKARPAAPGGAALRTSMSRDGDDAAKETCEPHQHDEDGGVQRQQGDKPNDCRVGGKTGRGHLSVPRRPVGEEAAHQHAGGTGAEVRRERDIGRLELEAIFVDESRHREIVDAAVGEADQHVEHEQSQDCRRHDLGK